MKKLNKLFAILFAVLGVGNLSAQTDVTSTYLTNAGFDDSGSWITGNIAQATSNAASNWKASSSGDTWWYGGAVGYGSSLTVNSVTPPATNPDGAAEGGALGISAGWGCTVTYTQEVTLPAGVYTLSYAAYNANTGATQATNLIGFVSSSASYYGKTTSFAANTWTTEDVTFALTTETTGNISVGMGAISGGSGANAKLFVDGVTLTYKTSQDVTESNPSDLTSMAGNTVADWTFYSGVASGESKIITYDGLSVVQCYASSSYVGDAMTQTIEGLPMGNYKAEVYCMAHSAWISDVFADGATGYTYLYANDKSVDVPARTDDGATTKQLYTIEDIKVNDGTLTIRVHNAQAGANWISAYINNITFLGPDKTLYEEAFNTKYASLSTLSSEGIPTAFATKIANLKTQYNVEAATLTLSELETANAAMDGVINSYEGVTTAYASLNTLITTCESLTTISAGQTDGATATYATAISTAETAADAAIAATELTNAYNTLEAARRTYMQNAYPTSGNTLDFSYLLEGADWDNNSGSFTTGGIVHEEKYAENPWVGDVMWDEISGLANGMYNVEVHFSASAAEWNHTSAITDGDQNTSITVNNVVVPVGVYKRKGVDTPTVVTFNDVMVKDGTMDFMITNTAEGANWLIVAHKSITMTGKIDNTALQNELTAKLTTANGIKDSDMNSTVKTNLTTAIDAADATSEDPDALNTMIENLTTAIAAAETSVADYAKLKMYIDMTAVFTTVTDYQTKYDNGEYTSTDVDPVRKELNVARFNAASTVFTNKVEVTGWTGDLANTQLSSQHWSGESKYYYDANSWTANYVGLKHTLSTTVTLPNGKYVLKAAGRSSSDATLRLNIKNGETTLETVEYTGKGDTGYGIDTSGAANFSAEGTYANGDAGRGWEWEFAQFELDAETEVTLHVEVDYNSIQNRFGSFSDITLWMDDATYVTVYGKELDAPLAEAKTLVNTLPMGEAENTALEEAIALGEGEISTPVALNVAVEALNTAVANANTWRATYNTEKGKLVAALERFEADYNDAENGALDYMAKNRWETVIAKAQAAAVAKDDLTSHEGLTTATNELIAALDAATVSIDEYAALDEAIKAANALAEGVNWGDKPFQRPESAKAELTAAKTAAETAYNAAEADGEDVTSLTETLNTEVADVADVTLNTPAEGNVFHITVATEDHKHENKCVVTTFGATGANNPTGYGFNASVDNTYNPFTKAYTFEQVEGNNYRISVKVNAETVYLTYGSLNGSAAGWNQQQIQGTTNVENAGEFKIEASTTKEGVVKIFNTVYNEYLDCQDGGSVYTDTDIEKEDFALTLVDELTASVDINISTDIQISTCVLMFDVQLPTGLEAYVGVSMESDCLILQKVEGTLPAYTPCLLYAENGFEDTLEGVVAIDSYTDTIAVVENNFLCGAIDESIIADGYVLQKQNENFGFYKVNAAKPKTIPAGKCWLSNANLDVTPAAVGLRFINGGATKLNPVLMDKTVQDGAIYTIDGKRVERMERGQIYIINGQKVMIK